MSPQGVTPQKYFPRITASHIEGNAHSVRFRQHQFHKLHSVLVSSKPQLVKALIADNGYTDPEAEYEFSLTLSDLRKMYESVDFEDELASSLAVQRGQDSLLRKRGLGIVYIRPERSKSSLYAVLSPLCAALAAGNCIIVEIPQTTQHLALCLRNILPEAIDHDIFAISETLPPPDFVKYCGLVDQTNSDQVKTGAVKQLVSYPTSSPSFAFVDRTADVKLAARCIAEASFAFKGNSPYAPDMVFVHEAVQTELISHLLQIARTLPIFSANAEQNDKFLASKQETTDVEVLLAGRKGRIVLLKNRALNSRRPFARMDKCKAPQQMSRLSLYTTRSTDDMLDSATDYCADPFITPAAAFIFSNQYEGCYIANALNADITCLNNFPAELSVGPRCPRPMQNVQTATATVAPRYAREMFEERKSAIQSRTFGAGIVGEGFLAEAVDTCKQLREWAASVAMPLRSTGQPSGKHGNFFLDGLYVGTTVIAIPLLGSLIIGAKFLLKRMLAN